MLMRGEKKYLLFSFTQRERLSVDILVNINTKALLPKRTLIKLIFLKNN